LKPAEEAIYRNKMLDLAATQLRPQAGAAAKEAAAASKKSSSRKAAGKLPQPAFDNVSLRIFDLSSSNEPVLVLSAKTHPVALAAGPTGSVEEPKEIMLIARTNLEGELRKLFFFADGFAASRRQSAHGADRRGRCRRRRPRRIALSAHLRRRQRVCHLPRHSRRLWPLFEPTP